MWWWWTKSYWVGCEDIRNEKYLDSGPFVSLLKLSPIVKIKKIGEWIIQKHQDAWARDKKLRINTKTNQ